MMCSWLWAEAVLSDDQNRQPIRAIRWRREVRFIGEVIFAPQSPFIQAGICGAGQETSLGLAFVRRNVLAADEVIQGLTLAHEVGFFPIHENFGHKRAGVVIGRHGEAVRTCA